MSPYPQSAVTTACATPAARARSSSPSASAGLVANVTAAGTRAAARRAASAAHLRQVQPGADRPVAPRVGVVRRDHRLAVRQLAQLAAVLALDPDRVLPLLRQLGVVEAQHPRLRVGPARADHQAQPPPVQRRRVPRAVHQELLQLLQGRPGQHLRHPLGVLARQVRDQPQQVVRAVPHAALARKDRPKLLDEPFQLLAIDFADDQLHGRASWWLAQHAMSV